MPALAIYKRGRIASRWGMSGESEHTVIISHTSVFYLSSYRAHKRPFSLLLLSYSQMIELVFLVHTERSPLYRKGSGLLVDTEQVAVTRPNASQQVLRWRNLRVTLALHLDPL